MLGIVSLFLENLSSLAVSRRDPTRLQLSEFLICVCGVLVDHSLLRLTFDGIFKRSQGPPASKLCKQWGTIANGSETLLPTHTFIHDALPSGQTSIVANSTYTTSSWTIHFRVAAQLAVIHFVFSEIAAAANLADAVSETLLTCVARKVRS